MLWPPHHTSSFKISIGQGPGDRALPVEEGAGEWGRAGKSGTELRLLQEELRRRHSFASGGTGIYSFHLHTILKRRAAAT